MAHDFPPEVAAGALISLLLLAATAWVVAQIIAAIKARKDLL